MSIASQSTPVWVLGNYPNLCVHKDRTGAAYLCVWLSQTEAERWAAAYGRPAVTSRADSVALLGGLLFNDKTKVVRYVVVGPKPDKADIDTISIAKDVSPNSRITLSDMGAVRTAFDRLLDQCGLDRNSRVMMEVIAERVANLDPRDLLHNFNETLRKFLESSGSAHEAYAVAVGERGEDGALAWRTLRPKCVCANCRERTWRFERLSPNGLAAIWTCEFCGKRITITKDDDAGEGEPTRNRLVPKSVQREVWQRDQGRCVRCASRSKLEFDHIIPVAKGGSNTARNVQLLCEDCNRSKAAKSPDEG